MTAPAGAPPRHRASFAESVRETRLENGAEIYVLENHFNPTVALSGSLDAGPLFAPPDRRIVAPVAAGELTKGTARRSKLEIAEALESRAASLAFACDASDPMGLNISGSALSRDTDLLLDLLAEILREPSFPEEELDKEKKRLVGAIRQQQDQTSARAIEAAMRRIYPRGHPLHRRTGEERIASVEALERDDVVRFFEERYGAATLRLVVVGDVSAPEILEGLAARLSGWRSGPPRTFPPGVVPAPSPGRENVSMPDKASADVVLAEPSTLARRDAEYLPCILANAALGQSALSSRLGVRVRDTAGLTYGIHSSFSATHLPGPFYVSVTVKPENRDAAVAATIDEIARFLSEGMTDKELENEKSSRIGKFKVDLASNAGIANAIDAALYYELGIDYLDRYPELVGAVTRDAANAAFAQRVDPNRFTIVSAGAFPSGV